MKYGCRQPINENHSAQQEFFVSIKVSKEIAQFPQARVRIPNAGVCCKQ